MKLKGRILLFDTVNCNRDIFPKDCKITFPAKIPLTWNFQHEKVIGFAEVTRDNKGLIATAEIFTDDYIREILTDGKIGAGGFFISVKKQDVDSLIVVTEARLVEVALVLAPVCEEYLFEIVGEGYSMTSNKMHSLINKITADNNLPLNEDTYTAVLTAYEIGLKNGADGENYEYFRCDQRKIGGNKMIKLDENSVAKIIKIAMTNNEKCNTCEFSGMCFFAYSCLSNSYEYYLKGDTRND